MATTSSKNYLYIRGVYLRVHLTCFRFTGLLPPLLCPVPGIAAAEIPVLVPGWVTLALASGP